MAIVTAIDVGSYSICTIQADISTDQVRVEGVGIASSSGMLKGLVIDMEEAKRAVQESIERAESKSGAKVTSAYVSVSGRHIHSRNNRVAMQVSGRDRIITDKVLREIHDRALDVPLPEDREMLWNSPRLYYVDGVAGIRHPKGMAAFKLESEVHIITGGCQRLQDLREVLEGSNVTPEPVVGSLAASLAVLDEGEKEAGVILADIGHGTTDVAVFKDGHIWHTFALPVGGAQLTRDLAAGLGVPLEVAEELKKSHGNVNPEGLPQEDSGGMVTVGVRDKYSVSYEDLRYIIQARIEEILRMVILGTPQPERGVSPPTSVVLTGGTANLAGLEPFAQNILGMPVRVGGSKGVAEMAGNADVAEILADPAYAVGVGLLQYHIEQGAERMASSGPSIFSRMGSRIRDWFSSYKPQAPIRRTPSTEG